jgi:hypothetical protein
MDKLAKQLRTDAERIECTVSEQLDARIRASLHGVTPEQITPPGAKPKSFSFWFASSLTGVAAAAAIIAIVNLQSPEPAPGIVETAPVAFNLPKVQWKTKTAVLTGPLEQEIENLQSDLKKAEEAVKQDIDRLF